jgi:hypothetical protein
MDKKTLILGWGSLIYDLHELEDQIMLPWQDGGPKLPIEFSRISKTRDCALSLVIDPTNGIEIPTQYIVSKRINSKDAACDLRNREGTLIKNIGIIDLEHKCENYRYPEIGEIIKKWIIEKNYQAVVWTDLKSNFEKESFGKVPFTIEAALNHLNGLCEKGKEQAKTYFKNAPEYVDTPLRRKLISSEWYL